MGSKHLGEDLNLGQWKMWFKKEKIRWVFSSCGYNVATPKLNIGNLETMEVMTIAEYGNQLWLLVNQLIIDG